MWVFVVDLKHDWLLIPFCQKWQEIAATANAFSMFSLSKNHLNSILNEVDQELENNEQNSDDEYYFDKKATLFFIRGSCLKQMKDETQAAVDAFLAVIDMWVTWYIR